MQMSRTASVLVLGGALLLSGCGWYHVNGGGGGAGASASNAAATPMRPELSPGTVKQVQSDLKSQGLYTADVDGKWGPETVRAVLDYQRKHNLRPSGELDSATLASLNVTPQAGQPMNANNNNAGGNTNANANMAPAPGNGSVPAVGNNMPAPPANSSNMPQAPGQTQ
jgi:peptidoglycan hydrolase-like protein with peptidoglycan-binding domain